MNRAEATSRENINKYYTELYTVLIKYNLDDKTERNLNIDVTGVSKEHSPVKIFCSKNTKPQAVTSNRSTLTTIIAAENALGNHVQPYYDFKGKRWSPDVLNNAVPGAGGKMSETGWCNSQLFQTYMNNFFFIHIWTPDPEQPTRVLYNGHI